MDLTTLLMVMVGAYQLAAIALLAGELVLLCRRLDRLTAHVAAMRGSLVAARPPVVQVTRRSVATSQAAPMAHERAVGQVARSQRGIVP
jgi:hypothetical protein